MSMEKQQQPDFPAEQGLYNPDQERDSCGVGFVVDIKGRKSHDIVQGALEICVRLDHRGGCGCDLSTGDGAGIFMQISHNFFSAACEKEGIQLPEEGQYGIGFVFLPKDDEQRAAIEKVFEEIVEEEGLPFLGWRTVPVDNSMLGKASAACEPLMRQAFIGRSADMTDVMKFERKLYVINRVASHRVRNSDLKGRERFYISSMSSRTMIYKGMLTTEQLGPYFLDLADPKMDSAMALTHSRFSTNTFPSWPRAQPFRHLSHNGEINTLRGNVNWMHARQALCQSEVFGDDLKKLLPIIDESGSDSAMFDNCLEFLVLSGRSLQEAVMMMIPEPWENHKHMSDEKRDYYQFAATQIEPWDGPASIAFSDGVRIGAVLDRNGLRPSRYYVTKDDRVIMGSEVGVLDVDPANVAYKGRLEPGRMFLIDTEQGRIIDDAEIKSSVAAQHPYGEWLENNLQEIDTLPEPEKTHGVDAETLHQRMLAFGYTFEDMRFILGPMGTTGVEPVGSMGNDAPLAVLSDRPQLLYNYFKQLFAQVTNPPIDSIREAIITASVTFLGSEGNLLDSQPESCRMIKLDTPIVSNRDLEKIRRVKIPGFKAATLPILFEPNAIEDGVPCELPDRVDDPSRGADIEAAMERLFDGATELINDGVNILILSDRGMDAENAGIPALLAVAGLHHHLIREGLRTKVSIVLESGEPREVHHHAVLIGYGCDAINPYLAFESMQHLLESGDIDAGKIDFEKACQNYIKACVKGVIKTMSKMGISTIASYRGAQIFEAVGINKAVIDRYFTRTASRVGGIDLTAIAKEVAERHAKAFPRRGKPAAELDSGGNLQWRRDGEKHLFSPTVIHTLQKSTKLGDYDLFKKYSAEVNTQTREHYTLRGLMEFKFPENPIPIEEVESVEEIVKRFKTGAMSFGSISAEAHETLAIAMNRLGGKSNTGEGGEDPRRFTPDENGDLRRSAIKQVASGRFGVTSHYLVNSDELQIKMAQGAKPGEGGQLPGHKVLPVIAKVRGTTPGVGLISPPPHHDNYSIEDLAELIHDLKNSNVKARVNVKLVSEIGVGTVAAGVAKARADVILISGYDGGTGASPRSSIQHAGAPWELGLAETNQTLLLNDLRSRVVVETDGQLKTGRDVVIATLLGAEEYGFATAPLVTMGCLMMRVCHKNTCPVGVATQDERLRQKFRGDADYVVNFMKFIAQEVREIMAQLGFRTINEMVGRSDKLEMRKAIEHWKAKGLDYSKILYRPQVGPEVGTYCQMEQNHLLDRSLDVTKLLDLCKPAIENGEKVEEELDIVNTNRVVGTIVGAEISRKYGAEGLPDGTIKIKFNGSAGQSFGAFTPKGMEFELEGDANDYFGKGLSGSRLYVYPPKESTFVAHENILIGNVAFYGATGGEAFVAGKAGERFCVRNSGAHTVVEGVGDHGCEYMTGGSVICLAGTGRNFAAGMSGGTAYVLDEDGDFASKLNAEMVTLYNLAEAEDEEIQEVKSRIERHVELTGSKRGREVLDNWDDQVVKFRKVLPRDYERVIKAQKEAMANGLEGDDAIRAAFEANINDASRVGGN